MPIPPYNDQVIAQIRDGLPPLWRGLYVGCLQCDFTPSQALSLVQAFILAQNPNGSRPTLPTDVPNPPPE